VFDAIHNVQARTPTANVVAMLESVRGFIVRQVKLP